MRQSLAAVAVSIFFHATVFTGSSLAQDQIYNPSDGSQEGGWVVAIPAGSSDFFNARVTGLSGTVNGINVSVADFGASVSAYPTAGVYRSNLGVDATGLTPDLSSVITGGGAGAFVGGAPLFDHQTISMAGAPAEADMHAVVQFPAGDPGLLGIGADSDTNVLGGGECGSSPNPFGSSGFTTNGYSTASAIFASADFGLGPNIECGTAATSLLQLSSLDSSGNVNGDYDTLTTREGEAFGIGFWGTINSGVSPLWLLFISFLGTPLFAVGSPLPSIDCGNGSSFLRIGSTWPSGAGNLTITFVAIAASPGVTGSVSISNEITICSLPSIAPPVCGVSDDGTYESGWVVQIPTGSSDCFSSPWLGCGLIQCFELAVMDFGGSTSSLPSAGFAPPNQAVDPSGNSPDLSNPYVDSPLVFPPLTFATTSGQLVDNCFTGFIPLNGELVGFVQLPVGDPGLIGVGADTNGGFPLRSGWTLDGFLTPANDFSQGNWGLRAN